MRREHARALLLVLAVTTAGIAASVVGGATTPGASGGGTAAPSVGDAAVTTTATPTATTPDENATISDGLVVLYETGDGEVVREPVVAPDDVAAVGPVERDAETGTAYVEVTLTQGDAENFTDTMLTAGFGDGANCRYETTGAEEDPGECLLTVVNGEVVHSAGLTSDLGATIRNGDFVEDPRFVLTTENESQAEALRAAFGANGTATPTGDAETGTTVETETESTDGSVPGLTGITALVALCLALVSALANARRDGR